MQNISLRQFEYFIAIADARSISEASRILHISQPAMSVQLRKLEEECGTPLFTHHNQRLLMTDAGRLLYKRAKTILSLTDSSLQEVKDSGKHEALNLGITPTTMTLAVDLISGFSRNHVIHYAVHDGSTYELLDLLSRHVVEGAFVRTPLSLSGLQSIFLRKEFMSAVSSVDLGETATLRFLSSHRLILYRRYEQLIMEAFAGKKLKPEIYCLCDNARTAIRMAENSDAVAIIPESMEEECDSLHVSRITSASLKTDILFVYDQSNASDLLLSFAQYLKGVVSAD